MIIEIHLKGFQSHVNTIINLQNGLNVITGPSDSGKTAVIRAIRWVAFNEPQGEAFVNESVGKAEVKILLQDGSIITKHRKNGKTAYILQQNENDEGSIFEKAEVPFEVTWWLGIDKTSFGDFETALNFSFQLDAPFLISETASAGAKVLGKLAGTESVDMAIKGVSKDTYATRNMRSEAEKDIERLLGRLFDYQHIDDAKQSLDTAESLLETVDKRHDLTDSLKEYRHTYLLKRDELQKIDGRLKQLQGVPQLIRFTEQIEKDQQRLRELLQLQDDRTRLDTRISSLVHELRKFKDINIASENLNVVKNNEKKLTAVISLHQLYQKLTNDVRTADETLNKTEHTQEVSETLNRIENVVKSLSELRNTKVEYQNTWNNLRALQTKLSTFDDIQESGNILTAVERDEKRLAVLKNYQESLSIAEKNEEIIRTRMRFIDEDFVRAKFELQQAWDEAGGVCPLCESVVCEHV